MSVCHVTSNERDSCPVYAVEKTRCTYLNGFEFSLHTIIEKQNMAKASKGKKVTGVIDKVTTTTTTATTFNGYTSY